MPNLVFLATYMHRKVMMNSKNTKSEIPLFIPGMAPLKKLTDANVSRLPFTATDFWAMIKITPRSANIMAREAIQEEIRILVTINPIIRPDTAPTPIPQKIPRTGFTSPTRPMTTPLKASTAPTDRSISAHKITKVMPSARKPPFFAAFSKILKALFAVRKFLSLKTMLVTMTKSRNAKTVLLEWNSRSIFFFVSISLTSSLLACARLPLYFACSLWMNTANTMMTALNTWAY